LEKAAEIFAQAVGREKPIRLQSRMSGWVRAGLLGEEAGRMAC
jgi:hypothetical protein